MNYYSNSGELPSVGLDDKSMSLLSCGDAMSLLRILSSTNNEERIYSGAPILPLADGSHLYVKPH